MKQYNITKERARKYLKTADRILYTAYPLTNDPRLLLSAIDNIFLAITNSMAALLYYEKINKRIGGFKDNFDSKLDLFRRKCLVRYDIDPNYVKFILEVKQIILEHQVSPVEFVKKDKFVICSNEYKTKTIDINNVKNYLQKAKAFYGRIENILLKVNIAINTI